MTRYIPETSDANGEAVFFQNGHLVHKAASAARSAIGAALKGHIHGLTLSNNSTDATNDIDIAAGEAASTETNPVLMVLASSLTKRLDAAWAVGTGNGGLDTGSIANTTYHVWLIRRSDTGVVDALFSTSATSPTMPTGYDQKRRIGSIIRSGGAILAFDQVGERFMLDATVLDVSANNPGTSAVTRTLTVPTVIVVEAVIQALLSNNGAGTRAFGLWTALSAADETPGLTNRSIGGGFNADEGAPDPGAVMQVMTNTSAQIRTRVSHSDASVTQYVRTLGWIDTRGRYA